MWNCISKFCYDTYLKSYTGFKKNNSVFEHTKTSEKQVVKKPFTFICRCKKPISVFEYSVTFQILVVAKFRKSIPRTYSLWKK